MIAVALFLTVLLGFLLLGLEVCFRGGRLIALLIELMDLAMQWVILQGYKIWMELRWRFRD